MTQTIGVIPTLQYDKIKYDSYQFIIQFCKQATVFLGDLIALIKTLTFIPK